MLKVLIVEDDLMIADMTEEFLVASGYSVSGIARTVDKAIDLAKANPPDLAIIDLRLAHGGFGTDVASALQKIKRTGILFASGNITQFDLTADDGDGCLVKPYLRSSAAISSARLSARNIRYITSRRSFARLSAAACAAASPSADSSRARAASTSPTRAACHQVSIIVQQVPPPGAEACGENRCRQVQ